jgi:hypothetical protein
MKYYVYFDAYGHPTGVIDEEELAEKYKGDPGEFLKAMSQPAHETGVEFATGHLSILRFDHRGELDDYLDSLGDEIEGFYGGEAQSRPYNF